MCKGPDKKRKGSGITYAVSGQWTQGLWNSRHKGYGIVDAASRIVDAGSQIVDARALG